MYDYYLYVRLQTGTKYTYTNKKIHKIWIFFVIWRYVYLTLTFDLDKGHNLILSFDLKRVHAVAYLDEKKKMNLAF